MRIAIDIETVPNERAREYFDFGLAKVNSRLKDPKKIQAALDVMYKKSALNWWTGKVCCISWILVPTAHEPVDIMLPQIACGKNEKEILSEFAVALHNYRAKYVKLNLCGKSSKAFDFPFLAGRYLVHDLGLPIELMFKPQPVDVDEIFSPYGKNLQTASLETYAWALGIDGKLAVNGAEMVKFWYDNDLFEDMSNYCARDSEIVFEMMRRYRVFIPQ